ncbi:Gfo/Idh/MocA family protein [Microcella pacifica]|uniref:Gfo/Idh/MocA family oxidoreductase n=1 Tax=Microcella pacifica TaxID=2591847 RepID=A0A9E5JL03_9MICO|nr:Gfo/Idh/MocA family oxidoreductase [Microcella pacifica]NHF62339.1 Gfo/Idh/MocA family oxidoreductase [Microcella pacifica]
MTGIPVPTSDGIHYLPRAPKSLTTPIGLIGCGGISFQHLSNYRDAGFNVVALADIDRAKAEARRDEFYPDADVYANYRDLLARDDIEVVDIATHVDVRPSIVRDAILSGRHVLSQKPFVVDLDEGRELVNLAVEHGMQLAVNQNGRWAPHFSFLREAVAAGLIGEVTSADFYVYWDHDSDFADNPAFNSMEDLILYDFGIHWFDLLANLFRNRQEATGVVAMTGSRPGQKMAVATQAQVLIQFPAAQATLLFRGATKVQQRGGYEVHGTLGSLSHLGEALGGTQIVWSRPGEEPETITVTGTWWLNGMRGTMGELLVAIEEERAPVNAASTSLPGLALCFAALRSSRTGEVIDPRLPLPTVHT